MTNYIEHRANLDSILGDLDYTYDRETKTYVFKWSTKKGYLEWRTKWRKAYKELSKVIRECRSQRKEYTWSYRPKDNNTMPRRTKTGANPNYSCNAYVYAEMYSRTARILMKARIDSKIEAGIQYHIRLKEAA